MQMMGRRVSDWMYPICFHVKSCAEEKFCFWTMSLALRLGMGMAEVNCRSLVLDASSNNGKTSSRTRSVG